MRATAQALARSRTSDTDSLRLIFLEIQTVLSSKARKTYKSLARGAKRSGKPVILVFHRALLLSVWLEIEILMTKQVVEGIINGNHGGKRTCNLKDKHGATESPSSGTFVRADRQD